ncbi:glutaredoxin family protein [Cohnella sp. REN36]|uniref:glutaredoxin family protein n=1 Tax=Cohnella sp. REN36 TaxID=2887347 RepID=UPI001D1532A2|nr:glutaredoxin family protein [Cohnella sp. REN36]MCC3373621.1 glutaredoxin family protein [Cohnella sp. REN36]
MKEQVKIYTIPSCSDCNFAKRYFKEHQIPFTDFNCEEDVKYAEEVWNLTGKQVVPTLVIGEKVFVGFADHLHEITNLLK